MRNVVGGAVLVLGTGALGIWASNDHADRMEARVTDGADAALAAAGPVHLVETTVAGRDITVAGLADTDAERDAILAALNDVDGRRVVRDELTVLPTASPYPFSATKAGGAVSVAGAIPTEGARADLAALVGEDAARDLTLTSGAPDGWADAFTAGLAGLDALIEGGLTISDQSVTLSGLAADPTAQAAADAALANLPTGYAADTQVTLLDDGTPFRLTAEQTGGAVSASGKVPSDFDADTVAGFDTPSEVAVARIADPDDTWNGLAGQGLAALDLLESGTLTITDRDVTLTGAATRANRAAAEDQLAQLGDGATVTTDIAIYDDGAPMVLRAASTDAGTSLSGKLPWQTAAGDLGVDDLGADVTIAEIDARAADFLPTAQAGLVALGALETGTLLVRDSEARDGAATVVLTGTARNPAALTAARTALGDAGGTVDLRADLLDDGAPLTLAASKSGTRFAVSGKLPMDVPEGFAADALGRAVDGTTSRAGIDMGPAGFTDAAQSGLSALAQLTEGDLRIEDQALRLTGMATREGRAKAEDAVAALPDGFTATTDIAIADDGTPIVLGAVKDGDSLFLTGKLPFGTEASALGLSYLSGAVNPSEIDAKADNFLQISAAGLDALRSFDAGELSVTDATTQGGLPMVRLTGTAATPQAVQAAIAPIEALGPMVDLDVSTRDDGTPLRLSADWDGAELALAGKQNLDGDLTDALAGFGLDDGAIVSDVAQAGATLDTPGWPGIATAGLAALSALDAGTLSIDGSDLTLTGVGRRAALAAAEQALAGQPDPVTITTDLSIADDGVPMSAQITRAGDGTLGLGGKLPFGFDPAPLGLASIGSDATQAEITAKAADFQAVAARAAAALTGFETGTATVEDAETPGGAASVAFSGTLRTPEDEAAIRSAMGDTEVAFTNIAYLDDGSPAVFTIAYDANGGAVVDGKLPAGLTLDGIAEAMGLPAGAVSGDPQQGLFGDPAEATTALDQLARWLPEMDDLTLTLGDGAPTLKATAAPAVDTELLANGLRNSFDGADVDVARLDALPRRGASRTSLTSGLTEVFSGYAWLPSFNFVPSLSRCDAETKAILDRTQVNFVTGSARLSARSVRAVNALSGAIRHCLDADPNFRVEIGGHTDSTGNAQSNFQLSAERAQAVQNALIQRGIPPEVPVAVGFGDTRPIATNDTEEGRAANRRTTVQWTQ